MFTARFVLEYFKENQVAFENEMALNMGQILSIPFMILGLGLVIWSLRKPKDESNLRIVDPKEKQNQVGDAEAGPTNDKTNDPIE